MSEDSSFFRPYPHSYAPYINVSLSVFTSIDICLSMVLNLFRITASFKNLVKAMDPLPQK